MFTPTSDKRFRAGLIGGLLFLAGCGVQLGGAEPPAPAVTRVAGGQIQVAGPRGYCVDRSATRNSAQGGFVVMARCDALGGGAARPQLPALLTVSVARRDGAAGQDLPQPALMEAFADTSEGRAIFSRNGDPKSIKITETRIKDDVFLMQARDLGANKTGFSPEYWRAIFNVRGFLVSARVNAFSSQPISKDRGFETLNALAARIKADNAVSVGTASDPVSKVETVKDVQRPGLLARIFR